MVYSVEIEVTLLPVSMIFRMNTNMFSKKCWNVEINSYYFFYSGMT